MIAQILIADRDPVIRDACRRCLSAHGYDAAVAADGLQCIEQLQTSSPDVLVLDPEILWGGGAGVLAWLRDQAPVKPVRVVLTDGHFRGTLSPELQRMIDYRLERPTGLSDLHGFVHQLQDCLPTAIQSHRDSTWLLPENKGSR